uniref:Organic solute carrier partner 1 n=1 Tax=Eptatretus burgeri TaxID=7764 RepID=A0A8C4WXP2_EPTBU
MASRSLPLLFINLGGEMLYILEQRLQAQGIPGDKATKVLHDIIGAMFSRPFLLELFKPQEVFSRPALHSLYQRLAHTSIMRLNPTSMDKLYDLMTMAVKQQVLLCPRPRDLLFVTLNHLDAAREMVRESPHALALINNTHHVLIDTYSCMTSGEFQVIRQMLLYFFQDLHIRVSLFLKDKVQSSNGRFILPVSGPVPCGTEPPGTIRIYNNVGAVMKTKTFPVEGRYEPPVREGFLDPYGDRVTRLGTNMYSAAQNLDTQKQGKRSMTNAQSCLAPDPLATVELNLLADLLGEGQGCGRLNSDGFSFNLFAGDTEEGDICMSAPASCENVINIDASKQSQLVAPELQKVLLDLHSDSTVLQASTGEGSPGQDLLDMMDAL